jgi:uncharacterized protein YbjT (DUF2867 family)
VTVLVTGGTGTTGKLVTALLQDRGVPVRAVSRPHFDWYAPSTHPAALEGVTALYLVAPSADVEPGRVVLPFLELARERGVTRAVLLSSSAVEPADSGLGLLSARLGDYFPGWAVLRPSWFMENFFGGNLAARSPREGEIISATGTGRVAFADPADIAAVAVRALVDPEPHNTSHVITGPTALSYDDAVREVVAGTGKPLRHRAVGADELARCFEETGMPANFARLLAALDVPLAGGTEDRVTGTVERVTGRAPRSLRDFVAARAGRDATAR